jgi:predicted Zn-ribbon and HTH transcriptional regulator
MMNNYQEAILSLLEKRVKGKTICPSEVLAPESKKNKVLMEEVRKAARELVKKGKIVMTQKGQVVDPENVKGPIRLKLV